MGDEQKVFHHRRSMERHTDPNTGRIWWSGSIERWKAIVGAILATASLFAVVEVRVVAGVRRIVQAEIATHKDQMRAAVVEAHLGYIKREEWSAWAADKERRWQQQEQLNSGLDKRLGTIEADIKEILRRLPR